MNSKIMDVEFPSGHRVTLVVPLEKAAPAKPAANINQTEKHACQFVGNPIDVETGCAKKRHSVWECTHTEGTGKCAPLALVNYTRPGVISCRTCPLYEASPELSLGRLGLNYLTAEYKWRTAGKPTRTQEQVNELFAICNECPFLVRDKAKTHCGKCGCPVNTKLASDNKLYRATEACPIGRFDADVKASE